MSTSTKKILQAAAGSAGGGATYVEDVFSTYLYTGDATNPHAINNGIDLDGEGGMVWTKARNWAISHYLYDTERGINEAIYSDKADAEEAGNDFLSFDSDGYTLKAAGGTNANAEDYVSWTFREAPGFFDIVTYTGDAVDGREIAHNLGSVPGCIIAKRLDSADSWAVYHRNSNAVDPEDYVIALNTTAAAVNSGVWNDTAPTDSVFTVDEDSRINGSGSPYVAYLFAHDDQIFGADEDESIIKCGTYTGTGAAGNAVSLGWEPQYIIIKRIDVGTGGWVMLDVMRGMVVGGDDAILFADSSNAEDAGSDNILSPTADGFELNDNLYFSNLSGSNYIYIAIRRGPMKVPEAGTEVFFPDATYTGTGVAHTISGVPFPVDSVFNVSPSGGIGTNLVDRLRGATKNLITDESSSEATRVNGVTGFDLMDGIIVGSGTSGYINNASYDYYNLFLKRAPKVFDIVCYAGTGIISPPNAPPHGLTVAPELMIIKSRAGTNWVVYSNTLGNTKGLYLNNDVAAFTESYAGELWLETSPTSSVFTVGSATDNNYGTYDYVAYLFATLAGVSKVGSYTADATLTTIDCGFAAAARLILIKRTDSTGDWYIYDSERGIVAGNDPYNLLNTNAAQVTGTDYIDPIAAGFQITAAGSSTINIDTATYIFLAIA